MKFLFFIAVILLAIGSFSLNADSKITQKNEHIEASLSKLSGFKKDISVAD